MEEYKTEMARFVARKVSEYGEKFDASDLNPNFIHAYNEGQNYRVKVKFPGIEKPVWGCVGVTTGWKPTFLLMRRRGQIGSSELLGADCKILAHKVMK